MVYEDDEMYHGEGTYIREAWCLLNRYSYTSHVS